jgi:hypothetical protein
MGREKVFPWINGKTSRSCSTLSNAQCFAIQQYCLYKELGQRGLLLTAIGRSSMSLHVKGAIDGAKTCWDCKIAFTNNGIVKLGVATKWASDRLCPLG